jgi:propionyl-CoA carboxylase alpha chain
MIRVASGEPLAFGQDDVKLNGWAIENRVYAEDPYRGFLPSTGRLVRYAPPASQETPYHPPRHGEVAAHSADGGGAPQADRTRPTPSTSFAGPPPRSGEDQGYTRVDDGVAEGGEVSMFYDPMIAKLVTWAPTRDEAADLQVAALDRFVVEGVGNNVDFLSALMQHPRFRSGALTTGFIAEEYPDGFAGAPADTGLQRKLAALAAVIAEATAARARMIGGQLGDALTAPQRWTARIGEADFAVDLAGGVSVDGQKLSVEHDFRPGARLVHAAIDGEPLSVQVAPTRGGWRLTTRGAAHNVRVLPVHIAPLAAHMIEKLPPDTSKFLLCPMPGLLTRLEVAEGDRVEAGQPLAVVEAMKMENILRAERAGTVAKVNYQPGESLAVDAAILEFE